MFKHIFLKRLKYYVRTKEFMFWLLVFPIILSTLFHMAFANLLEGEAFEVIDLGVVDDTNYENDSILKSVLESVSIQDGEKENDDTMFRVRYVTEKEGGKLLDSGDIKGYIYVGEDGTHLVIKENGTSQTIIKTFLDYLKQQSATAGQIYQAKQGNVSADFVQELSNTKEYVQSVKVSNQSPNTVVAYFYTVLAMAAMYGAMVGLFEVIHIQANLSSIAMRNSLAPVSKLKSFFSSFLAACVAQSVVMLIILAYIMLVLRVDFGSRYLYVILTTLVSAITGLTIGTLLSAVIKKSEGIKIAIVIGFTMTCSYMAGMMDNSVKYKILLHAPILDRLNPCNLITDSYYKLYYYDNLSKYWENITILAVMAAVCFIGTVIILRRQRYESV